MKQNIMMLFLIFGTYSAWAGTNLLDLMKAKKHTYGIHSYCQNFIQSADHTTLKSAEIKKLIIKRSDLPFIDDYYFHYTSNAILSKLLKSDVPNRLQAQKDIQKDGGYKDIMTFQMTYNDALSNVAGVGFYLSSNPFSSANYGNYQIMFKVDPKAKYLDYATNRGKVLTAMAEIYKAYPMFQYCHEMIRLSLVMNENDVDIMYYGPNEEWVVAFNEDVLVESKFNYMGTYAPSTIIDKMMARGDSLPLLEHVEGIGKSNYHKIPQATFMSRIAKSEDAVKAIQTLASKVENWDQSTKMAFANMIARQEGDALVTLVNDFQKKNYLDDSNFMYVVFDGASEDFLALLVAKIKRSSQIAKNLGDDYTPRMLALVEAAKLDMSFYFANRPAGLSNEYLYKTYYNFKLDKKVTNQIIEHMLRNDSAYFKAQDQEAKYKIFNSYMANATTDQMSPFVVLMESNGYDLKASFDYILRRPSAFGANSPAFVMSYIIHKKDPKLLTPAVRNLLVSASTDAKANFIIDLKKNKAVFGNEGNVFAESFLPAMDMAGIDLLTRPEYQSLLSNNEQHIILTKILQDTSAEVSRRLLQFQKSFNFQPKEYAAAFALNISKLNDQKAKTLIHFIEKDKQELSSFLSLSNKQGIVLILPHGGFNETNKYVVSNYSEQFYKSISYLPVMNAEVVSTLLSSNSRDNFYNSYSAQEKLVLTRLIREHDKKDYERYLESLPFNPSLAKNHFDSLISRTTISLEDAEASLNNLSFIQNISHENFIVLLKKVATIKTELDIETLIESDLMNPDRSIALILNLNEYNKENSKLIFEERLGDRLQAKDSTALALKYCEDFTNLSHTTRTILYSDVLKTLIENKATVHLVKLIDSLVKSQKIELISYYLSSDEKIKKGLTDFDSVGKNFVIQTLKIDNIEMTGKTLKYIENNYPINQQYARYLIENRQNLRESEEALAPHFEKFICQKVNKYHAFATVISEEKEKAAKEELKNLRKTMCNWNGWF